MEFVKFKDFQGFSSFVPVLSVLAFSITCEGKTFIYRSQWHLRNSAFKYINHAVAVTGE